MPSRGSHFTIWLPGSKQEKVISATLFCSWLAFAAEPRGWLHVDEGARRALLEKNASLLAAGIREVKGTFAEGEPVEIIGPDGEVLGRGFVGYSSADLSLEAGHSSTEAGHRRQRPVVHRDVLILTD